MGLCEGPECPRRRKCLCGSLIEKEEIPGKKENFRGREKQELLIRKGESLDGQGA